MIWQTPSTTSLIGNTTGPILTKKENTFQGWESFKKKRVTTSIYKYRYMYLYTFMYKFYILSICMYRYYFTVCSESHLWVNGNISLSALFERETHVWVSKWCEFNCNTIRLKLTRSRNSILYLQRPTQWQYNTVEIDVQPKQHSISTTARDQHGHSPGGGPRGLFLP